MKNISYSLTVAYVLLILIPLIYILYWVLRAGEIPLDDYWGIISYFYSNDGLSTNPLNLLVHSNEHLILIPSIVYAINILTTKGSNLGLSLIALSFACIQSLLLLTLLPSTLKRSRVVFLLLLLCVSIFSFTPAAMHNWMRGFSGVAWIGTNVFTIASIFCLTNLVDRKQISWAIGSIVFGIFSYLTYSTSIALLPVLCAATVLMRLRLRLILLYFTFAIIVFCTFLITYKTPSHHPSISNVSTIDLFAYVPVYLGAIFTPHVNTAMVIGSLGLAVATGFTCYWLSLSVGLVKTYWLPWLSIQAYVVLTALMAAVSRSKFGIAQATASRYASLPSLFWLSLVVIIVAFLQQLLVNRKLRLLLITLFFTVVSVLTLSMYKVGFAAAQPLIHKASFQPLVALSLQLGASDPEIIREVVTPAVPQFMKVKDALKNHQLVPFNRNIKQNNFCAALGTKVDFNSLTSKPQSSIPGHFDWLTKITPDVAKVEGWSSNNSTNLKCIAILNQENIVRGFALSGFQRLDVVEAFGSEYEFSGWKGYVQILPEDRYLTAYSLLENSREWILLHKSHKL